MDHYFGEGNGKIIIYGFYFILLSSLIISFIITLVMRKGVIEDYKNQTFKSKNIIFSLLYFLSIYWITVAINVFFLDLDNEEFLLI